jgi:hypothetical protein
MVGKNIKVGDGTTRTFHEDMAMRYNETPKNKKSDESEDEIIFGEDGYSLERAAVPSHMYA